MYPSKIKAGDGNLCLVAVYKSPAKAQGWTAIQRNLNHTSYFLYILSGTDRTSRAWQVWVQSMWSWKAAKDMWAELPQADIP